MNDFEPALLAEVLEDNADLRSHVMDVLGLDEYAADHYYGDSVLLACAPCLASYNPPSELVLRWPEEAKETEDATTRDERPLTPRRTTFNIRNLKGDIGVLLAKSLLETAGYDVRHSGYEHTFRDWMPSLKSGDPNMAAARVRTSPDLMVYDRLSNNVYDVEVKTTECETSEWRYRRDALDNQRFHHPEVVLLVYAQQSHAFYAQRADRIDWNRLPVCDIDGYEVYEIDLDGIFEHPRDIFRLIEPGAYSRFLAESAEVLQRF